jgi:inner membrane protein YidH
MNKPPADSADPRVGLARERTGLVGYRAKLALDRTTLAWIRTTLTMASFGFGMDAFFRTLRASSPTDETRRMHEGAIAFGLALIVLGLVVTVLAGISHWLTLRKLRRGQPLELSPWPLSITVALLFAIIGLAGLWALFVR